MKTAEYKASNGNKILVEYEMFSTGIMHLIYTETARLYQEKAWVTKVVAKRHFHRKPRGGEDEPWSELIDAAYQDLPRTQIPYEVADCWVKNNHQFSKQSTKLRKPQKYLRETESVEDYLSRRSKTPNEVMH